MFKFRFLILSFFVFLLAKTPTYAFLAETFVPLIHVVDNFAPNQVTNQNPLDVPKIIYEESTPSGFFNTWVLTPNAVQSSTISAYFKKISKDDPKQEIGLFLTQDNNNNLQSLTPDERKIAIDVTLKNFFDVFGFYPKTVSSTSFDAYSLQYLQSHYSVLGAVIIPKSESDTPSKNGSYSHSPYFPSKRNILVPAKSLANRINLAFSETISIQNFSTANLAYLSQKQLNEFTQFNISTSNYSTKITSVYMSKFFKDLAAEKGKHNLNFITYGSFSDWFKARYPESSPAYFYKLNQVDGSDILYQSPWYKLTLRDRKGVVALDSLYVYNHKEYEPNIATPQTNSSILVPIPNLLSNRSDLSISKSSDPLLVNYLKQWDSWSVSLQNQTSKLTLNPDQIIFKGLVPPSIISPLIKVTNENGSTVWTPQNFQPFQNNSLINKSFWLVLLIITLYYLFKKNKPPFIGLLLVIISTLTMVKSGKLYPFGMGFWGPNGHDAIFHISIINSFQNNLFSLSHPQISGEILANYHFFFDYFSALIVKLTQTPTIFYYFTIFPVFAGIVLLKLLLLIFDKFKMQSFQKNIALILVFFGSSLGYLLRFLQAGDIFSGESAFWANQSVSLFLNPPFLLSLIILLAFFLVFDRKSKTIKDYILLLILGAILSQTKVYGFILLVLALFVEKEFYLAIGIAFLGLVINLPLSNVSSLPFVFEPLWFIKTMLESQDRAYWPRAADAWQAYEATGQIGKLIALNLFALSLFIFGNLGVRLLGFYNLIVEKSGTKMEGIIKSVVIISLGLPLLITQSINPWNSIQFLYYGLFLLAIFTAKYFTKFNLVVGIITFLGIFGSFGTLKDYVTKNSTSRVSYEELSALSALSLLPKGIVLSPPSLGRTNFSPPQPQYDYVTSSYISALSGQPEFFSDQINLDITGIDYQQKLKDSNRFYNTKDVEWAVQFLIENKIRYVYETPLRKLSTSYYLIGLEIVYTSPEITIYRHTGI